MAIAAAAYTMPSWRHGGCCYLLLLLRYPHAERAIGLISLHRLCLYLSIFNIGTNYEARFFVAKCSKGMAILPGSHRAPNGMITPLGAASQIDPALPDAALLDLHLEMGCSPVYIDRRSIGPLSENMSFTLGILGAQCQPTDLQTCIDRLNRKDGLLRNLHDATMHANDTTVEKKRSQAVARYRNGAMTAQEMPSGRSQGCANRQVWQAALM